MTPLEKFESLPTFVKLTGAAAAAGGTLCLIWLISTTRGGIDIPERSTIVGSEMLVDAGAGLEPPGSQDAKVREERVKALSEGVTMYGWVDSWPLNGEEVYAVGFDAKTFPYDDMANVRRLVGYAEHLMLENGCGTLKLLVYSGGRKYGDGADLLITATIGKPTLILSSGVYSPLEAAAGHPVKPNDVAEAVKSSDVKPLRDLLGKNLLVTMPVTEFYQTESNEWVVISSTAPEGYSPFPIPLRIQEDDPKRTLIKPETSVTFSVVLVLNDQEHVVEAYGKVIATDKEDIPVGIPASELR